MSKVSSIIKLKTGKRFRIPAHKLYLNDIVLIYQLIEEQCEINKFVIGEYSIDGIAGIYEIPNKINYNFAIEASNHNDKSSTIEINAYGYIGGLHISDKDDIILLGLAQKLQSIFRKNKIYRPSEQICFFTFIPAAAASIFIFDTLHRYNNYAYIGFVILFLSLILFIRRGIVGFTTFNLTEKSDSPTFYERNKDKLWIGIITTVGGAVLGALLTYILTR